MNATLLSQSERAYIKGGCLADCRGDGRRNTEFRPYVLQAEPQPLQGGRETAAVTSSSSSSSSSSSLAPLILSNGSARYVSDHAHMLCSVKADVVRPSSNRPYEGVVELHVSLDHAAASSSSQRRSNRDDRDALQDLLRDLLVDHLPLDKPKLCLVPHWSVWRIVVDVCVIATDGSSASMLADASALVVMAALQSTFLPTVTVVEKHPNNDLPEPTSSTYSGTSTMGLNSKGLASSSQRSATAEFELVVDGDITHATPLPGVHDVPAPQIVTVTLLQCPTHATDIGGDGSTTALIPVLDASSHEAACAHACLHVAVRRRLPPSTTRPDQAATAALEICALQTSGGGSIPLTLLPRLVQLASDAADRQVAAGRTTTTTTSEVLGGGGSIAPTIPLPLPWLPDRIQLR